MSRQQSQHIDRTGADSETARNNVPVPDHPDPFLHDMPEAQRALRSLVSAADPGVADEVFTHPARGKEHNLTGFALNRLLDSYGLTMRRSAFASTPDESAVIADGLGFPIMLQLVSPQLDHRSDSRAIAPNLTDVGAVRAAAARMVAELEKSHHEPVVDGYLVHEMVTGVELIVGAKADPTFGPFIVAGVGSTAAEAAGDVVVRRLPVDEETALQMLRSLNGLELPPGPDDGPAPDLAAVACAIAGLSRFFLDHQPWLTGVEITPLIALPEGMRVRAGNVRIVRAAKHSRTPASLRTRARRRSGAGHEPLAGSDD